MIDRWVGDAFVACRRIRFERLDREPVGWLLLCNLVQEQVDSESTEWDAFEGDRIGGHRYPAFSCVPVDRSEFSLSSREFFDQRPQRWQVWRIGLQSPIEWIESLVDALKRSRELSAKSARRSVKASGLGLRQESLETGGLIKIRPDRGVN